MYLTSLPLLAVPIVESPVNVSVSGPPTGHLFHVAFGDELLQLGNLSHPVKDPASGDAKNLGSCILAEPFGMQCNLRVEQKEQSKLLDFDAICEGDPYLEDLNYT